VFVVLAEQISEYALVAEGEVECSSIAGGLFPHFSYFHPFSPIICTRI